MATFTVGRHPENFIQRVLKIIASAKSLVERLCDFKIHAVSVLSCIGSPDKATKLRPMPSSVRLQDRTTLYLRVYLALVLCVVLVLI